MYCCNNINLAKKRILVLRAPITLFVLKSSHSHYELFRVGFIYFLTFWFTAGAVMKKLVSFGLSKP